LTGAATSISIPFCHGLVVTTRDRPVRTGTRVTAGLIFHDGR
jgi:hypothetical protein